MKPMTHNIIHTAVLVALLSQGSGQEAAHKDGLL